MDYSLADIPPGLWTGVAILCSSPLVVAIVLAIINRKKTEAEIGTIIGAAYSELLNAHKEERLLMVGEMSAMRNQQTVYMENVNELLKSNRLLSVEIEKLKHDHNECSHKNDSLNRQLQEITTKLTKAGIK